MPLKSAKHVRQLRKSPPMSKQSDEQYQAHKIERQQQRIKDYVNRHRFKELVRPPRGDGKG